MSSSSLDCVVIGYNETPFAEYSAFLRSFGERSGAYRDLCYSGIEIDGRQHDYIGLLNHVFERAAASGGVHHRPFRACEIPNLATLYLTNFLRRRGRTVEFINLFQYEQGTLERLLAANPLCVAITTTFYVMNPSVTEIVDFIKLRAPQVTVVVGGPLIANHARNLNAEEFETALEDIGADVYVVESQGEETLDRLVSAIAGGTSFDAVPNLVYRRGEELRRTATVAEQNSLDAEAIDWRLFSREELGPSVQTRTARSCAFACAFCNYPKRAGKLTLAKVETVQRELDSMMEVGGVENVVFIDDTFNVPLPRFKEICRMIIEQRYPIRWFSYFRASNADEEAIELMARSGCQGVFLGIESGSPRILENMNKIATVEKYSKGIRLLRERGVVTFASFITGFPGETTESVDETIAFVRENAPDYYRTQMWYCEPGTAVEQQRDKWGITGHGFVWRHDTMDSPTAIDHIDRIFSSVRESIWLPQWSFDFWAIPYFLGRGISLADFRRLMADAQRLMRLDRSTLPASLLEQSRCKVLDEMVRVVRRPLPGGESSMPRPVPGAWASP